MDDEKAKEDQEHNDDDGDDGEEQNEQQGELVRFISVPQLKSTKLYVLIVSVALSMI